MGELIFNAVLIAFFGYMAIQGMSIEIYENQTLSRLWPEAILVVLLALLIASTVKTAAKLKKEGKLHFDAEMLKNKNTQRTLIGFGLLICYAVLMTYVGFIISSIIIGTCFARILGERRVIRSVIYNAIVVLILFLIFRAGLNIILPRGLGVFKQFTLALESLF